jgi:PAS domain S-box-containing protein
MEPRNANRIAGLPSSAAGSLESTQRRVRFGFSLALLCLLISGTGAYLSVLRLNDNATKIEHTYQVMSTLDALLGAVTEAQIGGRRYITLGHPENLERYRQGLQGIQQAIPTARRLVAGDAAQQQRLTSVERVVIDYLGELSSATAVAWTQGAEAAQRIDPSNGRRLYDQIRRQLGEMKATEESTLSNLHARGRRAALTAESVTIVGGILAASLAAVALIAIRRQFAARADAEGALRRAKSELERRVDDRTSELRGIVESSDDAIITKTLDGIITSWNPGAERIFGHSAAQAIGRSMQLIIPPDRSDEEPAILKRLAKGERVDHFETVRVRADGSLIDISATISPLVDGSGRIVGASKIARDITERRAHERKVQAQLERLHLLEDITQAIGQRHDLKSIYQVVIRSLEENLPVDFACVSPYDATTERLQLAFLGTKNERLTRELDDGGTRTITLHGSRFGELVYEPDIAGSNVEIYRLLARAGLRAVVLSPLRVTNGVFAVMIAARCEPSSFTSADCEFLRQLSEHLALASHQAELHRSLQAAYDDLRQTQQAVMQHERLRALGQMASGVAHDINNALAPPALYVQILLQHDKSLSQEARGYLQIIERSLEDVANTIARLRLFYAARDKELTGTTVDLNQLIEQIAEITHARWSTMPQEHGLVIDLKRELTPDLPPVVGDESEIRDALTNLVFNAVDAMPSGGILTLRSRTLPTGADPKLDPIRERVSVEVSDSGSGMTAAVRARCLEPFFTTKGQRGSGLGLAMVYGMAQRHGADLEIDSEPGAGTTIRLIFPAATSMVASESVPSIQVPSPRRILIVDDDPLVLKALRDALEGDGHRVVAADGGERGIAEFTRAHQGPEPFAAVFTDLGMPHVDGRLVAKSVKALAPEVPVILLTGWGPRLDDDSDLSADIDRVLGKPPKLTEIRAALAITSDTN